jgi:TonB family protein
MLDLLRYATLATKASLLAVCAAGALAGLVVLALRFARRGPARFWLAPAFLALAFVPLAAGAGLSAAGVRRLTEDVALLGAHSSLAVRAGLAEALLPLLAGLFATFGVASLALLLLAVGRRRDLDATPLESLSPAIPAVAAALGLLALGLALGALLAAHALSAQAPYAAGLARGLGWTAAGLTLALLAASLPLALGAPRGGARRLARALALALPATVAGASLAAAGVATVLLGSVMAEPELPPSPPMALDLSLPPPPPPPPPPASASTTEGARPAVESQVPSPRPGKPARVGTDVEAPRKLVHVAPRYPPEALQARLQGKVILECVIGTDGRVEKVEVKRGAPLLDDAAREAVRQWVYEPTRLNGVPVPAIMTVTVDFSLR